MADFPTAKTEAVDNTTDVLAKHINNIEDKVGIDSSADADSLDYRVGIVEDAVYTWKGAWVTATAYVLNDTIEEDGSGYVCIEAHTSGTFATDLAASKWELYVTGVDADSIASAIVGVAGKTTPIDADTVPLIDSADSNSLKELTWANIKATIKTCTQTTDANGWEVYDNGVWKEYSQSQTGNPASIAPGGALQLSALSLPVGVSAIADVLVSLTGTVSFSEIRIQWRNNTTIQASLINTYSTALDATYYRVDWILIDA